MQALFDADVQQPIVCDDDRQRPRTLTWPERIESYSRIMGTDPFMGFTDMPRPDPCDPDLSICGRWVFGTWFLGQSWKVPSGYYGGYPGNFLKRVAALFPDQHRVLHLFAGKVDIRVLPGDTADIRAELEPTYVTNAHHLTGVPLDLYDLIVADPPYSGEDALHYGTTMIDRNRVMRALAAGCRPGTFVAWLDQVRPMFRKDEWSEDAVIGIIRSTNHRFRVLTVFRKV
jgi:hypothetical protein